MDGERRNPAIKREGSDDCFSRAKRQRTSQDPSHVTLPSLLSQHDRPTPQTSRPRLPSLLASLSDFQPACRQATQNATPLNDSPSFFQIPFHVASASPRSSSTSPRAHCDFPSANTSAQTNNLNSLKDDLHCSLCLDLFQHAVVTSCGHSYCAKCFLELWQNNQQENPAKPLLCANCRATINGVSSNVVVRKIISSVAGQPTSSPCELDIEISRINQSLTTPRCAPNPPCYYRSYTSTTSTTSPSASAAHLPAHAHLHDPSAIQSRVEYLRNFIQSQLPFTPPPGAQLIYASATYQSHTVNIDTRPPTITEDVEDSEDDDDDDSEEDTEEDLLASNPIPPQTTFSPFPSLPYAHHQFTFTSTTTSPFTAPHPTSLSETSPFSASAMRYPPFPPMPTYHHTATPRPSTCASCSPHNIAFCPHRIY